MATPEKYIDMCMNIYIYIYIEIKIGNACECVGIHNIRMS